MRDCFNKVNLDCTIGCQPRQGDDMENLGTYFITTMSSLFNRKSTLLSFQFFPLLHLGFSNAKVMETCSRVGIV